mmetsp:Transcript_69731/g.202170  ORF Transcript_69731/g.202170 Transcript_69731/m.202170 type:complete len:270 (+) Transcript_69731:103-912(+)
MSGSLAMALSCFSSLSKSPKVFFLTMVPEVASPPPCFSTRSCMSAFRLSVSPRPSLTSGQTCARTPAQNSAKFTMPLPSLSNILNCSSACAGVMRTPNFSMPWANSPESMSSSFCAMSWKISANLPNQKMFRSSAWNSSFSTLSSPSIDSSMVALYAFSSAASLFSQVGQTPLLHKSWTRDSISARSTLPSPFLSSFFHNICRSFSSAIFTLRISSSRPMRMRTNGFDETACSLHLMAGSAFHSSRSLQRLQGPRQPAGEGAPSSVMKA